MKFYKDRFKSTKERAFCFWMLFPFFLVSKKKKTLSLIAILRCRSPKPIALSDFELRVGDVKHRRTIKTPFYNIKTPKKSHFALMKIVIKQSELSEFSKHNLICLCKKSKNSIVYNALHKSYKRRRSPILHDRENGNMAYMRQSVNGKLMLTIRQEMEIDKFSYRVKERIAYLLARICSLFERKHPILMYEKFGRYEEGASILYEKLIDTGYKKIYYVADLDLLPRDLEEKYREHILPLHSFSHYFVYFRSYTFISTEQISRAVELDSLSFLVWKHCRRGNDKCTHIHLQHGVMYMISMASASRSGVRKTAKDEFYKQIYVVSSLKEAQHFIDFGGYELSDLYVTGIPKFDKAILHEGADRIVIMPTWRPWEEKAALEDPRSTTYYQFINRLIHAVPDELADKMIVLPHPLFNVSFRSDENTEKLSYDEILRDTKLLITDYSSISFDAFYRGSNVLFVWSELEDCLEKYGVNSALMLSEKDAFGDICYTKEELHEAILKAYYEEQNPKYIENFNTIVTFHDNKNCERVIDCLKRDGLL